MRNIIVTKVLREVEDSCRQNERDSAEMAFEAGKRQGAELAASKAAEEKSSLQEKINSLYQELETKTKVQRTV